MNTRNGTSLNETTAYFIHKMRLYVFFHKRLTRSRDLRYSKFEVGTARTLYTNVTGENPLRYYHSAYRLESCTDYALICVPYQTYIFGALQTSSNYSAPFFILGDLLVSIDIEYLYGGKALTSGGTTSTGIVATSTVGILL